MKQSLTGERLVFAAQTLGKISSDQGEGKAKVWAFLTPDTLILIASGKKPMTSKIPRVELRESFWNKLTNKLVLQPSVADALVPHLEMPAKLGPELTRYLTAETISVTSACLGARLVGSPDLIAGLNAFLI